MTDPISLLNSRLRGAENNILKMQAISSRFCLKKKKERKKEEEEEEEVYVAIWQMII